MKHLFTFFCILLFTVAIFGDDSEQEIEYYTYDQQVDSTGDYDSAYDDAYNGGYDDAYDGGYDDSQGGDSGDAYDGSYGDAYDGSYGDAYDEGYDDSQGGDDTYDDGEGDRRKRDVESSEDYEIYRYK